MPLEYDTNNLYDFEQIIFEPGCNIDFIINNFFSKYSQFIKGDKEYITYLIKKQLKMV